MKLKTRSIADALSPLLVFGFLVFFFSPELMLSPTTTTGGDMGSHFVLAYHMKNNLLPEGRLIGWYPNWLCGLPMFQFYFVPPYLLMALLSDLVSLEVAFKLVSVLGVFLLPLTAYFAVRLLGFEHPAPAVAAGFAIVLLFNETYSQWGANIPSTLAGEMSYMLSFSLTILLIGSLYRGVETGRHIVLNSVLLASVVLTHIYTAIFITAAALFFLLVKERSKNLTYLFKVFFLAGLITSFWTIPFLAKIGFSAAPKDVFYSFPGLDTFINPKFTLFYFFAAGSIALGLVNRERRISYFLWMIAALVFLILNIKHVNLLYIRFIPFMYFLPLLLAADGLGRLSRTLKGRWLFTVICVLALLIWVAYGVSGVFSEVADMSGLDGNPWVSEAELFLEKSPYLSSGLAYIPYWIEWNYEGLENKDSYETFKQLNDYVRDAPLSGRVDFEYSAKYDKFGTPRLFEASPVFTNRSTLEALLLESSLSFPYFYYIQKQVSQEAWWPGFPIEVPSFDPAEGLESLRIFNVQYFVASSEKTKQALMNQSGYRLIESIDEFNVYAVNEDSSYAEVLEREPILVVTDDWKQFSYDWFSSDWRKVFFVYTSEPDAYDLEHFRVIVLDKQLRIESEDHLIFSSEDVQAAIEAAEELGADCSVESSLSEDEISIKTSCLDRPLLVKVSYFPNWRVEGAERIYLASPSLMLVFPEKEDVRLFYGETFADTVGNFMSLLGLLAVFYWLLSQSPGFRKNLHEPLFSFAFQKTDDIVEEKKQVLEKKAKDSAAVIRQHLGLFLAALAILSLLSLFFWFQVEKSSCENYCVSCGYSGGEKHFRSEVVDSYDLGSSHQKENQKHDLVCTAACDPGREDLVYVSGGYVEFDMNFLPGLDNTLVLNMWDNVNCRSADLYINDRFATRIEGYGKYNWHDFSFVIDKKYINSSQMRVRLEHVNTECFGWDLSEARVEAPNCICY